MSILFPSRQQWSKWSLPSRLTAVGSYLSILGVGLTVAIFLWPQSKPASMDVKVYASSFRTRLLDAVVGDRALLREVTEDLTRDCLEEPIVAWVKPFTNAELRQRDDVGVRFVLKNDGTAPATELRISVHRWADLPPAAVTTSPNIQPASVSQVTSRSDTFDVIAIPRLPAHASAVVTYSVSLPIDNRNEKRHFNFPIMVSSADYPGHLSLYRVSIPWADSAEAALTGRPVNYAMSAVTPFTFEEVHGEAARALVPLKRPYCKPVSVK